ncbi:MAG: hypothetical protein WED83_08005, partial [Acidimicrobiia bacterium]
MSDPILDAITQLTEQEQRGAVVTVIVGEGQGSKAVFDSAGSVIAGAIPPALAESVPADAAALMTR